MTPPTLRMESTPPVFVKPYSAILKSSQFLKQLDAEIGFIWNTRVSSLSLLQGVFQTQGSNPDLPHWRRILYQLSHQGSPRILEWVASPSPGDLPDPGIKPGSPVLQADSLPTELWGEPYIWNYSLFKLAMNPLDTHIHQHIHTHTFIHTYLYAETMKLM